VITEEMIDAAQAVLAENITGLASEDGSVSTREVVVKMLAAVVKAQLDNREPTRLARVYRGLK